MQVSPTALQVGPGSATRALGINGQLGAPVSWSANKGYLTAGHVAQSVKASVDDGNGKVIGKVAWVRTASAVQPQGCAGSSVDVAVIELQVGRPNNKGGIKSTALAQPFSALDVQTKKGVKTTRIVGTARWWYLPRPTGVTLTEIYLSEKDVTADGDSGGPVLLSAPGGQVIGHIEGGGKNTSCFQDIHHQLAEVRKIQLSQTFRCSHRGIQWICSLLCSG